MQAAMQAGALVCAPTRGACAPGRISAGRCRDARRFGLLVLFALGSTLSALPEARAERSYAHRGRHREQEFAVRIHVTMPQDSLADDGSAQTYRADQVSSGVPARALGHVRAATRMFIRRYPPQLIHDQLSDIYVSGDLEINGLNLSGTFRDSSLWAVFDARRPLDVAQVALVEELHSEFSSILMRAYRFPLDEWLDANPAGFSYRGTGASFMREHDPGVYFASTPALLDGGFLFPYSTASLEEDVNMYAMLVFEQPEILHNCAMRYWRVAEKLRVLSRFYSSIGVDLPSASESDSTVQPVPRCLAAAQ